METLKKEVKFIESLMRQSELLTADEENFAEKIENIWEKALNYFDPEIVEASKRFIQIEKEKDELTEKQRSISDDYFSSETSEDTKAKIEEMEEQLEALEEEYNDTSDPAGKLKFISKTRRLVDSCIKKHEEIERIQNNKETILAAFQEILTESRNFDKTKIIRIEKSAFSITIVFTEDEYDRLFHDKSNGRHFPNTPFNAIKERATPEEEAGTINHENIHNLTEESIATENPERLFNHRLIRYKKNKKESMDEDSEILQSSLKILTNEQSYLDELHGEIIAAFEQAEETDFL
jgi:predicted P-loop ATPase/GTPase